MKISGKNKDKRLLYKLKMSAVTLNERKQLPSLLYLEIMRLKLSDNLEYIKKLSSLSEDYLRIKGYYKNEQRMNSANNEVEKIIKVYKK